MDKIEYVSEIILDLQTNDWEEETLLKIRKIMDEE